MRRIVNLALIGFFALPLTVLAQDLPQDGTAIVTFKTMVVNKNNLKILTLDNQDGTYMLTCSDKDASCITPSPSKDYRLFSNRSAVDTWLRNNMGFAYDACDNVLLWPDTKQFASTDIGVYCVRGFLAK